MTEPSATVNAYRHLRITAPESWVQRFAPLVRDGSDVLDLACGNGRHGRLFLVRGHSVTFIDRDTTAVEDLAGGPTSEVMAFDLEQHRPWPLPGRRFGAVVVVNYLWRPLFSHLIAALEEGGILLYDTFARGNERFASPRNPEHLLCAGELLDMARGALTVVAYEHGRVERAECPGVKQRLCAVRAAADPNRDDGEPAPLPIPPG